MNKFNNLEKLAIKSLLDFYSKKIDELGDDYSFENEYYLEEMKKLSKSIGEIESLSLDLYVFLDGIKKRYSISSKNKKEISKEKIDCIEKDIRFICDVDFNQKENLHHNTKYMILKTLVNANLTFPLHQEPL